MEAGLRIPRRTLLTYMCLLLKLIEQPTPLHAMLKGSKRLSGGHMQLTELWYGRKTDFLTKILKTVALSVYHQ